MTYVVCWCDLQGRYHCKPYVYPQCAANFVRRLLLDGSALDDDVRISRFDGFSRCGSQRLRPDWRDFVRGRKL